jgi:hypothetical protein
MEDSPRERLRRLLDSILVPNNTSQPPYEEPQDLFEVYQDGDTFIFRTNIDPDQFNGKYKNFAQIEL